MGYVVFNHFKDTSLEVFRLQERFRAHILHETPPKHQLWFKICLGRGEKSAFRELNHAGSVTVAAWHSQHSFTHCV